MKDFLMFIWQAISSPVILLCNMTHKEECYACKKHKRIIFLKEIDMDYYCCKFGCEDGEFLKETNHE